MTQNGVNQAKAANLVIGKKSFWRRYSSDLYRCVKTASIILDITDEKTIVPNKEANNDNTTNSNNLILDERLRERAKGVREGRDKRLSYDEAMEIFKTEQFDEGNTDESEWDIPKLEMEEEAWNRVKDWIEDVVTQAYQNYMSDVNNESGSNQGEYEILAITHSGTLRIMIERMVGEQLNPEDIKKEETDRDGKKMGRLSIPNTSITTIDVVPDKGDDLVGQPLDITVQLKHNKRQKVQWKTKLVSLTNTDHLQQTKEL